MFCENITEYSGDMPYEKGVIAVIRIFEHNFEVNAFIYSKEVNRKMLEQFNKDQEQCTRVIGNFEGIVRCFNG